MAVRLSRIRHVAEVLVFCVTVAASSGDPGGSSVARWGFADQFSVSVEPFGVRSWVDAI
jgi:hypothetical protein